jgi:Na+/melibiose symporter-like transporter
MIGGFLDPSVFPPVEPAMLLHVNKIPTAHSRECRRGARMLVSILITFLVVILVLYLINLLPLDGRAKQIARVVVIILGVISLLRYISI